MIIIRQDKDNLWMRFFIGKIPPNFLIDIKYCIPITIICQQIFSISEGGCLKMADDWHCLLFVIGTRQPFNVVHRERCHPDGVLDEGS